MNISENGKTVADYDYTVDGQLAKSNVNGKEESFVWDDLALIQRNSTELTNEPYVTGGNPIMAGDKALFNDMLGSTLGVAANGSYSPINRTSFGEVDNASNSDYNFFTGKPNVDGLGYAFLFRNYNANNGKWLSQDPLGYPDGLNNLTYCKNNVLACLDNLGMWTLEVIGTSSGEYTSSTLNYRCYDSTAQSYLDGYVSLSWSVSGSGTNCLSVSISISLVIRKTNSAGTADYGNYLSTSGTLSFSISVNNNGYLNSSSSVCNLGNGSNDNKITELGYYISAAGNNTYRIYSQYAYTQKFGDGQSAQSAQGQAATVLFKVKE